jgi:putative ABC transport system permease protein
MLALGIGANTAIFSVIHAVLLRPLSFHEPDRLVQVYETHMAQGWDHFSFSEANLLDLQEQSSAFSGIAGVTGRAMNITGDGRPERVGVSPVTPGFFSVLGVVPLQGRTFQAADVVGLDAARVLLISEDAWSARFGSDPQVVGRTVLLDGEGYEVVGVLPSGGPWLESEFYLPLVLNPEANRSNHYIAAIARLRDGVAIEGAQREIAPIAARVTELNAATDAGMGFQLEPSSTWVASADLRQSLWVFMGAVAFLLLIACMNLANLLLARVAARRRQVAMCVALGARKGRIVRQLLTESAVLCVLGAVIGLGVAKVGLDAMVALEPGDIPRLESVAINGWVLLFTLGVAIATGVVGGLLPAIRLPYDNLAASLREGGRSATGGRSEARVRGWLVSAETALSLILLVGAGLLVRSLVAVHSVDTGFDAQGRITFEVNVPDSYAPADGLAFRTRFLDRLRSLPQVQAAAAVHMRPVTGGNTVMSMIPVGETVESFGGAVSADWRLISRDYFKTMGLSILQGQDLDHQPLGDGADGAGPPMDVVLSKSLADAVWPGEDPVGKRAQLWVDPDRVGHVVGVVEDMRERGPGQEETMAIYFSYDYGAWSPIHFVAQTAGQPRAIMPTVRSILGEMDPDLPISRVLTMEEMVQSSTASRRFTMMLLAIFAGVAFVLALVGLYGVIADSVQKRAQELGVRVALGASSQDVLRLVIRQGMGPALAGIVVGLVGALALSRVLQSLLFGVVATDVPTYVGVGVILALAALVACWLPGRAALKLDPVTVLREG